MVKALLSWMFLLLVASSFASNTCASELPVLNVYVDSETKEVIQSPQGQLSRAALDKLDMFLNASGLKYELVFVDWPKAIEQVQQDDHSLIFQLLKTPRRASRFYWIMPVFEDGDMALMVRADSPMASQTREQWIQGKSLVACTLATAHCNALLRFGFDKKRIFTVAPSSMDVLEQLLMLERVDFIPGYPMAVARNLQRLGYEDSAAIAVATIDTSVDYLAAPKHLQETLLQQLLQTPQDDLPKLHMPCADGIC
ncbi:hypothetical protein P2G88_04235 [Aliiglaciecola sp. CAU 1673]|uniref:hypothetical protein n=1 Tax=Aliiglaciecola sp. CAU 1673 TaxID=3032595 RepID=UPI0023DAB490|nr:hypothetical protein [Aliiglaciecola sp. CAU 1673]MDF2177453.1 hypothetical protein [Aliiglaciecola sp. CAU 1673]